ncbi:unnamed protein product [Cylindrotheca closterium]|uniref:Uncharacterized protein n=1 Tax=Cylindrotheca closterium TaxID=2856 RepID=A0AAD2FX11_9STRA|nr:unnamed protein product [Cylindrotheca closterium]
MRAAQCPAFRLPKNTGKRLTGWLVRARVMALLNKESKVGERLEPVDLHTSNAGFNKGNGDSSSKARQFFSSSKPMKKVRQFFSPSKEDSPNLVQSGPAIKRGNFNQIPTAKDVVLGIFRDVGAYFTLLAY